MKTMKRIQYLLLGALVMLSAACKEEEPLVIAPTAITGEASDIYRLGATLSGNIQNPNNASVKEVGIQFSELESMAEYKAYRSEHSVGNTYSVSIGSLTPGKSYYYRAYASSGASMVKGEIKSFTTTESNVPVFGDVRVSGVSERSVDISVEILDEGGSDLVLSGFCLRVGGGEPTTQDMVSNAMPEGSTLRASIKGLTPGEVYSIRPYAVNSSGVGYGKTVIANTNEPTVAPDPGIYDLDDLVAFRDAVNAGADLSQWVSSDGAVHIFYDIDASSIDNWIPINEVKDFAIEGQGHTITLKKTKVEEDVHQWGFVLKNSDAIVNLNINLDMQITNYPSAVDGQMMVKRYGTVCAVNDGYISNCNATLNVVDNYGAIQFGGIACVNQSTIEMCNTHGNITNGLVVGGIAAENVAGIIGCNNYASLIDAGGDAVGGIAGYNGSFGGIASCINMGEIKTSNPNRLYGVGGIVGRMFNGDVESCQNVAPVEALNADAVGGIAGNAGEVIASESEDSRYIELCGNSATIVGPEGVTGNMIGILNGVGSEWDARGYGGTVNGETGTEKNAIGKDIRWGDNNEENKASGIYTLDDLIAFRDAVNNGADLSQWVNESNVINLYADIDATSIDDWKPIQELASKYVFDGNEHTISLKVRTVYEEVWALFGMNWGTIQNLKVSLDMVISEFSGYIISYATICNSNSGTIQNCHSVIMADVKQTPTQLSGIAAGNFGTISHCSASGEISGGTDRAGIVGVNDDEGIVSDCVNNITFIDGKLLSYYTVTGGIVGSNGNYDTQNCQVINCINNGSLILTTDEIEDTQWYGGIVGHMLNGTISGCVNNGDVNAAAAGVGGIVGNAGHTAVENKTCIITNCSNTGNINGPSEITGGIIGIFEGEASEMTGCTYGGTVNGAAGTEANAIGKDLRSGESTGSGNTNAGIDDIPTEEW